MGLCPCGDHSQETVPRHHPNRHPSRNTILKETPGRVINAIGNARLDNRPSGRINRLAGQKKSPVRASIRTTGPP